MKIDILKCPICGMDFKLSGNSVVCGKSHTFNISKKNSINFVNTNRKTPYDEMFFHHRQIVLENSYFDGILDIITSYLSEEQTIADLGCGEGYFSKAIKEIYPSSMVFGLDYSKYGINQAVKGIKTGVNWIVGNISNLPFVDKSLDVILNIFSPANYKEFSRVLRGEGLLIKVVPLSNHFKEIRQDLLVEVFEFPINYEVVDKVEFKKTFYVDESMVESIHKMSPTRFGIEEILTIKEITVHCLVVVMKPVV